MIIWGQQPIRRREQPEEQFIGVNSGLPRTFWQTMNERAEAARVRAEYRANRVADAMDRELDVGDIITWRSGGYFGNYISFGKVLNSKTSPRCITVLNQNGNTVTIWNTYNVVIIARSGNYDLVPESHKRIFNIE